MLTDYDWRCYLKEEQQIRVTVITLTTSPALLWGSNPLRRGVVFPANGSTANLLAFADANDPNYQWWNPTQSNSTYISFDDIGDLIFRPVWVSCIAGTIGSQEFVEVSVNAARWAKYQEYIRGHLP